MNNITKTIMSNRKQTSVDWLIKEISRDRVGRAIITTFYQEFEQAKQLNRQEISDAYMDSTVQFANDARIDYPKTAEQIIKKANEK